MNERMTMLKRSLEVTQANESGSSGTGLLCYGLYCRSTLTC